MNGYATLKVNWVGNAVSEFEMAKLKILVAYGMKRLYGVSGFTSSVV